MFACLLIFVAGGIGSVCRYLISYYVGSSAKTPFPIGTLVVNLLGSFMAGMCFAFFEHFIMSPEIKLTLMVGFLGGFTTFSTYTLETTTLLRSKEYRFFIYNILASTIFSLYFVILGMNLTKAII